MKSLFLLLLFASPALADDIGILNVAHGSTQSADEFTIQLTSPAPEESLALQREHWVAWCFVDENTPPLTLEVRSATFTGIGKFENDPTVTLKFDVAAANQCKTVQVTFLTKGFPSQRWTNKTAAATPSKKSSTAVFGLFAPIAGGDKQGADYSLSGTLVPAVGAKPLYSIDGSIQHRFIRGNPTSLAFTAVAKTNSSAKPDPNSFGTAVTLLYVPETPFSVKANLFGLEFDKRGNVMNGVSSGSVIWTHFHDTVDSKGHLTSAIGISLRGGVELGDNFKNQFTIANRPGQRGYGFIFRGVPGARLDMVFPVPNSKKAVRFNSSYTIRLPARDEIFLETRLHTQKPVPLLESNPRHYLENNLSFPITDFFSFTFQHSYGSLPPSFQFTNHRGSVGILFQAKQP